MCVWSPFLIHPILILLLLNVNKMLKEESEGLSVGVFVNDKSEEKVEANVSRGKECRKKRFFDPGNAVISRVF
jgi:hypothetical protein